jgi:hypothetical protein
MAVELRITIESEEDVKFLRNLADTFEKGVNTGVSGSHQDPWTEGAFVQFWNGLPGSNWRGLKPAAKRALREISKRPDGYPADELLTALGGITGSVLGGNLSSVGFGMSYFPEYVWAYTRQNGTYLMPSEAAKIIQQRGL